MLGARARKTRSARSHRTCTRDRVRSDRPACDLSAPVSYSMISDHAIAASTLRFIFDKTQMPVIAALPYRVPNRSRLKSVGIIEIGIYSSIEYVIPHSCKLWTTTKTNEWCKYKSPSVLLPHFWLSKCKLNIELISLWGLMHKIYPTSGTKM